MHAACDPTLLLRAGFARLRPLTGSMCLLGCQKVHGCLAFGTSHVPQAQICPVTKALHGLASHKKYLAAELDRVSSRWVWICIAALILANVILHVVLLLAAQYLGPCGHRANVQSEETLAQRDYVKHGGKRAADVLLQIQQVGALHAANHLLLRQLHQSILLQQLSRQQLTSCAPEV